MSYMLTLQCGCRLRVSCQPRAGSAQTRIVQQRGPACRDCRHRCGARLWLWELLPITSSPLPELLRF